MTPLFRTSARRMNTAVNAPLPEDNLALLADTDAQRQAAHMAQDAFGRCFRQSVGEEEGGAGDLATALGNWARAAGSDEGRALRLAMLLSGMDQWGLAWTEAFGLAAIPSLSSLIGDLRTALPPEDEARFLQQYDALAQEEGNGIDFKVELRRGIHLALWHAAIAAEERDEAMRLTASLGGLLLGLTRAMPMVGWRLVADALANIQIRCLADGLASEGIAQEATQALFAALSRELPAEVRDAVMAHAGRAAVAWQQARRPH